jgi:CheY-like chemotaxis protein
VKTFESNQILTLLNVLQDIIYNPELSADEPDKQDDEKLQDYAKILLVEDNDEIREYLLKQLSHDYIVAEAQNGNIALEMIRQDPPDFILSDIMMPGISGFELCSILKNDIETCHIPVILLSSLAERSDVIKGLNAGADDYITKPFDMSILESKIKGNNSGDIEVRPGMTATVDIKTGSRSILSFLLKPITKTFSSSLGER